MVRRKMWPTASSGYIGIKPSQNFQGGSGSEIFAALYKGESENMSY